MVDDVGIGIYLKIIEENHGLPHLCVFQSASDTRAFKRLPMLPVLWYKGILMARLRDKETRESFWTETLKTFYQSNKKYNRYIINNKQQSFFL